MTRALWALKLRVQHAKKCNQLRRSQEEQTSGERSTSDRATVASLGSTGGREGNAAKHGLNSYLKKEMKAFSHECMNYEYIRRFLSLCCFFCHVTSFIRNLLKWEQNVVSWQAKNLADQFDLDQLLEVRTRHVSLCTTCIPLQRADANINLDVRI